MPRVLSVVLVEDDEAVRASVVQTLELAGMTVIAFEDAESALDQIQRHTPGAVIADIRLPGMDGLALLQHALQADADLPVVVLTGHGDVPTAVEAMRAGAYDFIQKPFRTDRLVETVRRALERRRLSLGSSSTINILMRSLLSERKSRIATLSVARSSANRLA